MFYYRCNIRDVGFDGPWEESIILQHDKKLSKDEIRLLLTKYKENSFYETLKIAGFNQIKIETSFGSHHGQLY